MSDRVREDVLDRARDAAARGAWDEAFALFLEADPDRLATADLTVFGEVAYASGHLDVTIETWERAHALSVQAGDQVEAARAAVRVAMHLLFDTALMAPVRGWLARAERLLEDQDETPAHAWLAVVRAYERLLTGDQRSARLWARRAIDVGSRCEPAACAIGQVAEGRLLILNGDVDRGLALLEEVGVATVSGELDPLSTGIVYCELVCALQGLAQYDVAEQWTEAMERWSKTNAIGSIHGRCRVHRAEILRLRGSYDEAEKEAIGACEELRPYLRRELGWPLSELGRIRFRRGDVDGAEQALLAAHRAGWDPQPTLALVRLARGDVGTAAVSIRDALERPSRVPSKELPPDTHLQRAPLLEAQVEIEIAAGEIDRARSAADELKLGAARFQSNGLAAGATLAEARVRLAEGDSTGGERLFSEAARLWNEVGAPYEAAMARLGLAEALRAGGSEHQADLELQAARALLQRIEDPHGGASTGKASSLLRTSTSFVSRATTGWWPTRGTRYGCETSRACATSRGSSPTPAGSSMCWTSSRVRETGTCPSSSARRTVCRRRHSGMRVRSSTHGPRRRIVGASPRSTMTSTRRVHSETSSGLRRPTPSATSSFASCRRRSAWAVAIDEPHRRRSGPGSL